MSYHFSAEQYDKVFNASRLGSWEVPKWYPKRPCGKKGTTQIIANDCGHLLPGVKRSTASPWGSYIGTWYLPQNITRQVADNLVKPREEKFLYWEQKCVQKSTDLTVDRSQRKAKCGQKLYPQREYSSYVHNPKGTNKQGPQNIENKEEVGMSQ